MLSTKIKVFRNTFDMSRPLGCGLVVSHYALEVHIPTDHWVNIPILYHVLLSSHPDAQRTL